jgi:phospholipase C
VYFVVPDGRWSDHATKNIGLGPDYVANIVNLVGRSATRGACPNPMPNWNNTVLLITWDDWGGWYDHVSPSGLQGPGIGYPNNTGGQYVYGFRVPLLVVSTYARQHYISGTISNPLPHDFGSILNFIETTFGLSGNGIDPVYPYADAFMGQNVNNLSDFFDCLPNTCQHPFQPITLVSNPNCNQTACGSNQCDVACFIDYIGNPKDPDDE